MKLITSATALVALGSEFRILTGLYAHVDGDSVTGGLYLRGFGDPTLRLSDLTDMAAELADRGVTRVDEVVVDGSYFDNQILPPAFDEQPNEVAAFRSAIGAVSVDENAYELRILPGATEGAPAIVRLAAAGYFQVTNELTTTASGEPAVIADQRAAGSQLSLRLRGTVPIGIRGVSYHRRIEHPLMYAANALVEALRRVGIRTANRVRVGQTPPDAALIVSRRSEPIGEMIQAMGKDSDNFYAEMLLKVVGGERRGRPASTRNGVLEAQAMLASAGVPRGAVTMVNGSGLFHGNAVAASHFTRVLSFMFQSPATRDEYLAHLAIAGVDGTLHNRLTDVPRGVVRAKTGTLNDVIALSGYVLGPTPDNVIAFSILANDVSGKHGPARQLTDDIVRALVRYVTP